MTTINKHKLRIVATSEKAVKFSCEFCVAGLIVERWVIKELLLENGQNFVGIGFNAWGECHGR